MPNNEEKEVSGGQRLAVTTTEIAVAVGAVILLFAVLGTFLGNVFELYRRFLEWFYSGGWEGLKRVLTVIFTVLNALLIGIAVYAWTAFRKLKRRPQVNAAVPHTVLPKEEVRESWEQIRELANSENPSEWNMAVLRADALLDDTLRHLGYEGTTLAERLKIVDPTKLRSLDNVWSAHRLRNLIAHDPIEQHSRETVIHTLRSYEQALKELGMMEETK